MPTHFFKVTRREEAHRHDPLTKRPLVHLRRIEFWLPSITGHLSSCTLIAVVVSCFFRTWTTDCFEYFFKRTSFVSSCKQDTARGVEFTRSEKNWRNHRFSFILSVQHLSFVCSGRWTRNSFISKIPRGSAWFDLVKTLSLDGGIQFACYVIDSQNTGIKLLQAECQSTARPNANVEFLNSEFLECKLNPTKKRKTV